MESWVYIFSQFTPEALVLELALIFILLGSYAIFWLLRKRRFGVIDKTIPSGPVKAYLNELIGDADNLRNQLFGLLSTGDDDSARDRFDLGKILSMLEAKLDAQGRAIDNLASNGVPILAGTIVQTAPAPVVEAAPEVSDEPAAPARPQTMDAKTEEEMNSLWDKVNILEMKLAEYNIIEDDLANLKRLQQENVQLRAALANKGGSLQPTETPPSASEAPSEPKIEATPEPAAEAPPAAAASEPVAASVPASEPVVAAPIPTPDPVVAAQPPAPAAAASETAPRSPADMGEDDLVKEFEKMLQG